MKTIEVQNLELGVYRIFWKTGGYSVASVGIKYNGDRWMCCANWTSDMTRGTDAYGQIWNDVKHVELIEKTPTQKAQDMYEMWKDVFYDEKLFSME